ncbi:hypothetical protein PR048_014582 [Dryococelus australis]|uniref:Uncharacterized protein n=1 Tax=Dryococelus australis TaxID=614101 RepID=A0ABQ9HET3_9NEOP|nr:hypothetical protein PR048_014582 [Dryococelus australis]
MRGRVVGRKVPNKNIFPTNETKAIRRHPAPSAGITMADLLHNPLQTTHSCKQGLCNIGAGMKRRGKRDILEKTRRPTASSGTIPTCESLVTRPGIEPGSSWWEASVLIAQLPWPPKYFKAGFLEYLPFPPPPLHSGTGPYSPRFTLIDSQDLDVKSRPHLFIHLGEKAAAQVRASSAPVDTMSTLTWVYSAVSRASRYSAAEKACTIEKAPTWTAPGREPATLRLQVDHPTPELRGQGKHHDNSKEALNFGPLRISTLFLHNENGNFELQRAPSNGVSVPITRSIEPLGGTASKKRIPAVVFNAFNIHCPASFLQTFLRFPLKHHEDFTSYGAAVAERLACSPFTHANWAGSLPDFRMWEMGIVPDDAAGRCVFSGISRFFHACIPALLYTSLRPRRLSRKILFGSSFDLCYTIRYAPLTLQQHHVERAAWYLKHLSCPGHRLFFSSLHCKQKLEGEQAEVNLTCALALNERVRAGHRVTLQPFMNFTYPQKYGVFQHDNASCHRHKLPRTGSRSILEIHSLVPTNSRELWVAIQMTWVKIFPQVLRPLEESMPRRIAAPSLG